MERLFAELFVVLIEPSSSQSKIVIQQFEALGIGQYRYFENGTDALESIFNDVPDLVISSLHLEDMTGKDLVLRMRENPATENTPFILISTATSFRDLDPIRQAGASAVLPKPFEGKDLRRAMLNTMEWENPDQLELEDLDPENMAVLVVDDSKLARKMIMRTLEKMGMEKISEADDGAQAIPLIQNNHYDLIITDYNMPEIDGYELLKFVRNQSNQSSVPVLMVTTEGDEGKLTAVQQEGVSAIIDKPFEVAVVKQLIESAMSL